MRSAVSRNSSGVEKRSRSPATSRVGAVMRCSRGEASNRSSAATVTSMSEGSSTRWPTPNSHIRAPKARSPGRRPTL